MLGVANGVLFFLSLIGISAIIKKALRIPLEYVALVTISLLIMSFYFLVLTPYYSAVTRSIFYAGLLMGVLTIPQLYKKINYDYLSMVMILLLLIFVGSIGLYFNYSDDYAYWGIIAKHLYVFHALPLNETYIINPYRSYLPGVGLWQNYIFQVFNQYSMMLTYITRGLILGSIFLILLKNNRLSKTLYLSFIFYVFMNLMFGAFFRTLQVDSILACYIFAVLWIYSDRLTPHIVRVITACCILMSLYLVKEIGIFYATTLLTYMLLETLFYERTENGNYLWAILILIATFIVIVIEHSLWQHYRAVIAANTYSGNNPLAELKLLPTHQIVQGTKEMAFALFFSPGDALKLPYIIWYLFLAYLIYHHLKCTELRHRNKEKFLVYTVVVIGLIYIVLLTGFEIHSFGLGERYHEPLSFRRYFNEYFAGVMAFYLLKFSKYYLDKKVSFSKAHAIFWSIVFLVFFITHNLHHNAFWKDKEIALENLIQKTNGLSTARNICVIPNNGEMLYLWRYILLGKIQGDAGIHFFLKPPSLNQTRLCDVILRQPDT